MPLPLDELKPYAATRRYQLPVVAASMADVVQSAGGWLCDRARAGWDVDVLVPGGGDFRALAILGATARDEVDDLVDVVTAMASAGPIAISGQLLGADHRMRESVLAIVQRGMGDVTVFGPQRPADFGPTFDPVEHTLSSAARAFKVHALAAVAVPGGAVSGTETLFRMGRRSDRPLRSV